MSKQLKIRIDPNKPIDRLAHRFDEKTLFQILLARLRYKLHAPPMFVVGDTAIINLTGVETFSYLKDKRAVSKFEERLLKTAINNKRFVILDGEVV